MKKGLFVLAVVALLIVVMPALAEENLDATYVSPDGTLTFAYPSEWALQVDMDGTTVVLDANTTVYIYSPAQIAARGWRLDDPVEMVETILTKWGQEGDAVSTVRPLESAGRRAAMGYYIHDGYPGFLLLVELSDGSLCGVEAVGNRGENHIAGESIARAIADTLDVVDGGEMSGGDLNQAWLDTINALQPGSNP